MVGAKVDGKIVPINHEVKTGEVIEILTTNQPGHGTQPRLAQYCGDLTGKIKNPLVVQKRKTQPKTSPQVSWMLSANSAATE